MQPASVDIDILRHHCPCAESGVLEELGVGKGAAAGHKEIEAAVLNGYVTGCADALAVKLLVIEIERIAGVYHQVAIGVDGGKHGASLRS